MGLTVNTNVASLVARRRMGSNLDSRADALNRLSSGDRIVRSSVDPSGLAISEYMRAQIRGLGQAYRNANDGISKLQVAEGGLGTIGEIGARLKELALQASSDTLTDEERAFADGEFRSLVTEARRTARSAEFNGVRLLAGGDGAVSAQVGVRADPLENSVGYNVRDLLGPIDGSELAGASIGRREGARAAIGVVDDFIDRVSRGKGQVGGLQNRLEVAASNLSSITHGKTVSYSKIRDADVARAASDKVRTGIVGRAGAAVLAQANSAPRAALGLLS